MKTTLPDFAIYDLETTGMSPEADQIIQIAAVRMVQGVPVPGDRFFSYVNPGRRIPAWISMYTGVRDEDVAQAPSIQEVLPRFSKWAGESVLLAHNGNRFDIRFLHAVCDRYFQDKSRPICYCDSINLSWQLWGRRGCSHGLDAVMSRLSVDVGELRRHDAWGDTLLLARCVEGMLDGYLMKNGGLPDLKIKKGYLPSLYDSVS